MPEFHLGQEVRLVGLTALPDVLQGSNRMPLSCAAAGFEVSSQPGRLNHTHPPCDGPASGLLPGKRAARGHGVSS